MGSIMADLDLMLDLSPVDYNSRAIVSIEAKESLGKLFTYKIPTCFIGASLLILSALWAIQWNRFLMNGKYS